MRITDIDTGGVNKCQSGRLSQMRMQECTQGAQAGTDALYKAAVRRQAGEVGAMVRHKALQIEMLEGAVMGMVKIHQNGHNFTHAQTGRAITLTGRIGQQRSAFRQLHKVIKLAEMIGQI